MPEEWDTGLKLLIGEKPQDFISWLVPGAKYRKVVSPHLPGRKIDADSLFEIILNGKAMLFHIEFQSYRDLSIVKRLWEYNVRATLKYKLPVLSFVFYLKREKKPAESPYIWELPNGEVIHRFQFAVVKLWEERAEALKQTGLVGLLPLIPLTQDGSRLEVVDEVITRLEANGDESTSELLALTYLLSTLVFKAKNEREWLDRRFAMLDDLIRSSWGYKKIKREGLEEGRQEGLQQGLQEGLQKALEDHRLTLLEVVRGRFPALEPVAKKTAKAINEPAILRHMIVQLSMAESEEMAKQALLLQEKSKN